MKSDVIVQLHKNFEDYVNEINGEEFCFARELQSLLGYTQWRNFELVIDKAKTACQTAGHEISDHFANVGKKIPILHDQTILLTSAKWSFFDKQPLQHRISP